MKKKVAVIMGSDSDLDKMQAAIDVLEEFAIPTEVKVVSAHRTPEMMVEYSKKAKSRGIQVIIAGAGGAAHLPGMVASLTPLPVIGVPVEVGTLKGVDALLSVAQMPKGVPVATMAVNNSYNAGLMAARIWALGNKTTMTKLGSFVKKQKAKVRKANLRLQKFLSSK